MTPQKISLTWGMPERRNGRWRLGLFFLEQPTLEDSKGTKKPLPRYWKKYRHQVLHISVRGILVWGTASVLFAYLAGSYLVLNRWKKENPHNQMGFLDVALPSRWDDLRRLRAEGWAAQGREMIASGSFQQGFILLRRAVESNPADFAARLDTARLYLAMRLVPLARRTLRSGLVFGYPGREYLDLAFTLARESDDSKGWLELVEQSYLSIEATAEDTRSEEDLQWLYGQMVNALNANNQAHAAMRWVTERLPETNPVRRELTVLSLIDEKRTNEALNALTAWIATEPNKPEPRRLLAIAARDLSDFALMDQALEGLKTLDPTRVDSFFYALVQNQMANRAAQAERIYDEIMWRFGADEAVHAPLALVLAQAGLFKCLDKLERDLTERGLASTPVESARLHLAVTARNWSEARRLIKGLQSLEREAVGARRANQFLTFMSLLAEACLDESAGSQSSLVDYIAERPGTLKSFYLVIEALIEAGRFKTASRVLALTEGPYPDAARLPALRGLLETKLAQSPPSAPAPTATAIVQIPVFPTFENFNEKFNRLVAAGEMDKALTIMAQARREFPTWLEGKEIQMEEMELPLRARNGDMLELQLLTRRKLRRASDTGAILDFAETLFEEGKKESAFLIVQEAIRHQPQNDRALALLQKWKPTTLTDNIAPL